MTLKSIFLCILLASISSMCAKETDRGGFVQTKKMVELTIQTHTKTTHSIETHSIGGTDLSIGTDSSTQNVHTMIQTINTLGHGPMINPNSPLPTNPVSVSQSAAAGKNLYFSYDRLASATDGSKFFAMRENPTSDIGNFNLITIEPALYLAFANADGRCLDYDGTFFDNYCATPNLYVVRDTENLFKIHFGDYGTGQARHARIDKCLSLDGTANNALIAVDCDKAADFTIETSTLLPPDAPTATTTDTSVTTTGD